MVSPILGDIALQRAQIQNVEQVARQGPISISRMSFTSKKKVFLSHSGLDAREATELATGLEQALAQLGWQVEVFNTSEPEHRYATLESLVSAGHQLQPRAAQYEIDLRTYLSDNLHDSAAFVLLVTPRSLAAASKVIEYEIDMAHEMITQSHKVFFFPCVSDVARLFQLPQKAGNFQNVTLDEPDGLMQLAKGIRRGLEDMQEPA